MINALCYLVTLGKLEGHLVNEFKSIGDISNKKKLNTATGAHFNLPGHSVADVKVTGIERVLPKNNDNIRKIRESFLINRYESATFGLNKKD